MTVSLPKISIVTPSYNQGASIGRTIESIVSQGYPNLEYLVIDGGSTDQTVDVLKQYSAQINQWVSEPDRGQADALQKGFQRATGEILGWVNSDDCLEPGSLEWVGTFFAENPSVDWLIANDVVEIDHWAYPNIAHRHLSLDRLLAGQILYQDAIFFRRRLYEKTAGVDPKLWGAMDYDLWLQFLLQPAKFALQPQHTLSRFVTHVGQKSQDRQRYRQECQQARSQRTSHKAAAMAQTQVRWEQWTASLVARLYNQPLPGLKFALHCLLPNAWYFHDPKLPAFQRVEPGTNVPCPLCQQPPTRFHLSCYDNRFHQPGIYEIVWCDRCDLGVTRPQLSQPDLVALYRQHYSQEGQEPIQAEPNPTAPAPQNRLKAALKNFVSSRPVLPSDWQGKLLDFGCNDGEQLAIYQQLGRFELYGFDVNPAAAGQARQRGFQIHCGDFADAPWSDHFFDAIVLSQVIEHLPDPIATLRQLRRKLKPDGHLLLTCPNASSFWAKAFRLNWAHWHVPYHLFHYTPRSLQQLAISGGFRLTALETRSPAYWLFLSQTLQRYAAQGRYLDAPINPRPTRWQGGLSLLLQGLSAVLLDRPQRGDMMTAILQPNLPDTPDEI